MSGEAGVLLTTSAELPDVFGEPTVKLYVMNLCGGGVRLTTELEMAQEWANVADARAELAESEVDPMIIATALHFEEAP